ncbi:MAG TPA: hypothetical protein VIL28_05975 [Steroidobacteraceae bacterium]
MIFLRARLTALCLLAFSVSLTEAADYRAPRTSFGHPDLQGVWTNATLTTLERPANLGDKLVLTEQEARAMETAMARRLALADAPSNPNAELRAGSDPGGYNLFWMDPGTKIAYIDGQYRSSLIVEPANGRLPPFTPLGAKLAAEINNAASQRAFEGPEGRPLGERCLVAFGNASGPPMLPVIYNSNYQIVQTPEHVMIMVEMAHDARIIHLDGKRLPEAIRPWFGHSVGRWEGDTLVVETTQFNPQQYLQIGAGASYRRAPTSAKLKVTERFTRTGPTTIRYQFTVEDPEIFTSPWKGEIPFHRTPMPIYEYACHEGNYALPGILAGAREEEKAQNAK